MPRAIAAWLHRTTNDAELERHQYEQHSVTWRLDDGTALPMSVVRRIAPESFIRTLIRDADNRPINASAATLLEYDHVPDFAQTGHTVVEELQLRCALCHQRHHRQERAA